MKKFTKICLVISLALIVIGGGICVLGTVFGGWRQVNEMDKSGGLWRFVRKMENRYMLDWVEDIVEDIHLDVAEDIREEMKDVKEEVKNEVKDAWHDAWDEAWDEMEDSMEEAHHGELESDMAAIRADIKEAGNDMEEMVAEEFLPRVPAGSGDTGIAAAGIRDMQIDIGGAALCFLESENENFGVKINGKGDYKYYESRGKFYLEGDRNHRLRNNDETVFLYIPKGKVFDKVKINVGGGIISLAELDAHEVELTAGAGIITCTRISCHELEVGVGAGEVVLNGIDAEKLDIDVGLGTAYVTGRIGKEIDASCGMGVLAMELDNAETDFNYEIECEAGGVSLGNRVYNSLIDDIRLNNGASGKCSLECSMGSIEVVFTK